MLRANGSFIGVLFTGLALVACGGSQTPPSATEAEPAGAPAQGADASPSMTAEACEASGGTVVGDIGDGAIRRPDYKCASGAKPSAKIRSPEGAPIAIEGSVCCPK